MTERVRQRKKSRTHLLDKKVVPILAFLLVVFSPRAALAQSCSSLNNQVVANPWLDQDGLLPLKHNPASVPPAD